MILENMDLTVDPCDNFYEFTCGGFINRTRLADDQLGTSTFGKLSKTLTQSLSGKLIVEYRITVINFNCYYHKLDLLQLNISDSDNEAIKNVKRLFNSCLDPSLIHKIRIHYSIVFLLML